MATATVQPGNRPAKSVVQTQLTPTQVVTTIPYASGQQQTFRLDRTMYYRSINLRLRGAITTTGASTTTNVQPGDEWGCVALIEIIANGGNVLRRITGEQLCVLNYLLAGYSKQLNTLQSGAGAAYSFDSVQPLWFILPAGLGKNPVDTTLNATLLSDLFIRITWGGPLTVNNLAGTTFTTAPSLEVSSDLSFFLNRTIVPAFSLTQLQSQLLVANLGVTGTGTGGFNYQIPVGQQYPFMLLNTKNTGTQVDAPNCLGTGLITSGTNQIINADLGIERYTNQFRQFVPVPTFANLFTNANNHYDAWTLLVYAKQRLLTESLNLVNFQNCQFYIQNTGGASGSQAVDLSVTPLVLFPTAQVTG